MLDVGEGGVSGFWISSLMEEEVSESNRFPAVNSSWKLKRKGGRLWPGGCYGRGVTSKMASTSTATPKGSEFTPTATRA